MRAHCPHCRSELDVPSGVTAVICNSCHQAVSIVPEGQTLTEATAQELTRRVAPTAVGRQVRLNCPRCHREFTVPLGESGAHCPRCGASFEAEGTAETRTAQDATSAGTGKKVVSDGKGPSAQKRREEQDAAALRWMRAHFKDSYEILDFVGRGGMGAVYRARQGRPVREVALKVMMGGAFASERHRKRFEREAQAVALLKHPAIVPVYEYGEAGGQPYFTMEFVEGSDLRTYVRQNNLSMDETCRLMVRVCDAIHYAHQHGVIHRDLKPGNIMVDNLNRPRILDFGLSRTSLQGEGQLSVLTMTGDFLGTPRYMSPEQAMGRPQEVDERTDVYALGVVLFELVVGIPPYSVDRARGPEAIEILRTSKPVSPRDFHPGIPRDLELIMLKAIEKDRELRYRSAEALAQDLENYLEGRPISARTATIAYRLRKWAWRNRKVLTPVLLSAIVIGVLTAAFMNRIKGLLGQVELTRQQRQEERQRAERFLAGARSAGDRIEQLIARDQWQQAAWNAEQAAELFPEEAGVTDLPAMVRRKAERRTRTALERSGRLVREQKYTEAKESAEQLTVLAELMPSGYADLRDKLADIEARFAQHCWDDLATAIEEAYARQDILERLDQYSQFARAMSARPHLSEAQELRERMAGQPAEFFMEKHVHAFRRAMSAMNWQDAETVLRSAEQLVESEPPGEPDVWRQRLTELRGALDPVIRKATAGKVTWLRNLALLKDPAGGSTRIRSIAFSPDGALLAVGARGGMVMLWDSVSGKIAGEPLEAGAQLRTIAISPDGAALAAGCDDGAVQLWSLADRQPGRRLQGHDYPVRSVDFSPDGGLLLSADNQKLLLWDLQNGERLATGDIQGKSPALFSPDGRLIAAAAADGKVCLWHVPDGKLNRALPCEEEAEVLAFSPDGRMLAMALDDNDVLLWDVETGGAMGRFKASQSRVWALTFSPDGRLLATGGGDRLVTLWDVETHEQICEFAGHTMGVYTAAFSPYQRLLATGSSDSTVRLWGLATAPGPGEP